MTAHSNAQKIESLKQNLVDLEKELDQIYYDAGKTVLETSQEFNLKINQLVEEIIIIKKALVRLENLKKCSICCGVNEADGVFCKYCGSKFKGGNLSENVAGAQ